MELTNKQWELIEPLFPERELKPSGKGRPVRHPREVLDGVLWVLKTGAQWSELPYRYPPYQICHRRFSKWVNDGVFEKMVGGKAYDSDPLDRRLMEERNVELIAPHKANRVRQKTQDRRKLRRYGKRWRVERLFAWLQNYRRIQTRWEYHLSNYQGFVHLGCILILMKHF